MILSQPCSSHYIYYLIYSLEQPFKIVFDYLYNTWTEEQRSQGNLPKAMQVLRNTRQLISGIHLKYWCSELSQYIPVKWWSHKREKSIVKGNENDNHKYLKPLMFSHPLLSELLVSHPKTRETSFSITSFRNFMLGYIYSIRDLFQLHIFYVC